MLFKTTTIMACMMMSDLNLAASSGIAATPAQALTISVPADWQLKTLVDGAHMTEPKARAQTGREIVLQRRADAPNFDAAELRDTGEKFHIAEFAGPEGSDFVLTAWREFSGGWIVLRAFAHSRTGRPAFADAWQIFESVERA